jgi:hypothetical protein
MQTLLKTKNLFFSLNDIPLSFFFSIDRETQCGSFSHPELLQTCVIYYGCQRRRKKVEICFFQKEKNHILQQLIV